MGGERQNAGKHKRQPSATSTTPYREQGIKKVNNQKGGFGMEEETYGPRERGGEGEMYGKSNMESTLPCVK